MMKAARPNRIVKLPRELYLTLDAISYFQNPPLSTNDFIVEILMVIAREYGEIIQKETNNSDNVVNSFLKRTNLFNNPEDNNSFLTDIKI